MHGIPVQFVETKVTLHQINLHGYFTIKDDATVFVAEDLQVTKKKEKTA